MSIELCVRCLLHPVVGKSGRAIIEAIISGERDAEKLANKIDYRVRKTRAEVIKALTGDWRDSYVFELKQSYELYLFFHQQIADCDRQMELVLEKMVTFLPTNRQAEVKIFEPQKKNASIRMHPSSTLKNWPMLYLGWI